MSLVKPLGFKGSVLAVGRECWASLSQCGLMHTPIPSSAETELGSGWVETGYNGPLSLFSVMLGGVFTVSDPAAPEGWGGGLEMLAENSMPALSYSAASLVP